MPLSPLRADEYRSRAVEEIAAASASGLERVRAKHQAAAARWMDLASLTERGAKARQARTPKVADSPQMQEAEHGQGSEEIEPRNA